MHHNCTLGLSDDYGLQVRGSSSPTVQLVYPLTKEQVALDNGEGGNWGTESDGDIKQIKTIDAPAVSPSSSSAAAAAAPMGETKCNHGK